MPRDFPPRSEASLLRVFLIAASEFGAKLFRNQRGVYTIAQDDCKSCQRFGRKISTGMANGAPDLVGWLPVTITPAHVGRTLAVFVGLEAKRPDGGRISDDQRRFLDALARDGAVHGVVRSVAEVEAIVGPWADTTTSSDCET